MNSLINEHIIKQLHPFQVEGVDFVVAKLAGGGGIPPSHGVLIADEMGLSWAKLSKPLRH